MVPRLCPVAALTLVCVALPTPVSAAVIAFTTQAGFLHHDGALQATYFDGSSEYSASLLDGVGTYQWTLMNSTSTAWQNARFLAFLDADIDADTNGYTNEYGAFISVSLIGGAPVDAIAPSSWEIDEPGYVFGDIVANLVVGALDNTNAVPSSMPDDVSLGLGFVLGAVQPGQTVTVLLRTSLAPVGGLSQTDPDTSATFYFNGYALVRGAAEPPPPVPEPGTFALTLTAVIVAVRRRRSNGRAGRFGHAS